jgi:hypothetical protein
MISTRIKGYVPGVAVCVYGEFDDSESVQLSVTTEGWPSRVDMNFGMNPEQALEIGAAMIARANAVIARRPVVETPDETKETT